MVGSCMDQKVVHHGESEMVGCGVMEFLQGGNVGRVHLLVWVGEMEQEMGCLVEPVCWFLMMEGLLSLEWMRVGEDHLLVVLMKLSLSLEKEHQAELSVVDHQILGDQLDLEDQIREDLQVQKREDHQVQSVVDHQVQDEVGRQVQDEDLQVLNVVVHQVQMVDSCQEHLEVDIHLEGHLVGNCSVVLVDTHCLVGSCSELGDTVHRVVHCIHQVHCLHSCHYIHLVQMVVHHILCLDHCNQAHHQNIEVHILV